MCRKRKRCNEIDVIDKFTSHENHNNIKSKFQAPTNPIHQKDLTTPI